MVKLFLLLCCSILGIGKMGISQSHYLWNEAPALKEIASTCSIRHTISKGNPQPFGISGSDETPNLSNPKMKISLWGPPDHLTLSINKNDVWDRRIAWNKVVTLKQIKRSYFSAKNKGNRNPYGLQSAFYMTKKGKWIDPYAAWHIYPFPCVKPVGQVILQSEAFKGIAQPQAVTSCRTGVTEVQLKNGEQVATIKYLTLMGENIIALHVDYSHLKNDFKLRLYRHRDTYDPSELKLPKRYSRYNILADSAWNGPLAPPQCGRSDGFFWIKQKMPKEKTFPAGFEYVMMGAISGSSYHIDMLRNRTGLGTPILLNKLDYQKINKAKGKAVTATLDNNLSGSFTVYITVATTNDDSDIMDAARQRLQKTSKKGWSELVNENKIWYGELYDKRESGRIFSGHIEDTKQAIPGIFYSWIDDHMMGQPDPTHYEADAHSYSYLECDSPPWHGLPCYNELYNADYLGTFNRIDQLAYYVKLVEFWHDAARKNANTMFGLPGLYFTHGYLPPIKPDRYPHTNVNYEFALEMPAQLLKYIWVKWDYGGNVNFLKAKVYPLFRDMATFYAAYLQEGEDGKYHIEPTIPQERWILNYQFKYNRDALPSITMIKWAFQCAAKAAEILNVDERLRTHWLLLIKDLPRLPIRDTKHGQVWLPVEGDPGGGIRRPDIGLTGKHGGLYDAVNLSNEVNLDSDPQKIKMAIRTAKYPPCKKQRTRNSVFHLLGCGKNRLYTYFGISDRWQFKTMKNEGQLISHDYFLLNARESQISACWIEPERLLNSRSGIIHLFPCVPDHFTIAFKKMLARGGFEISAEIKEGIVKFISIKARRNNICSIENPYHSDRVSVSYYREGSEIKHFDLDNCSEKDIKFKAKKGITYFISAI